MDRVEALRNTVAAIAEKLAHAEAMSQGMGEAMHVEAMHEIATARVGDAANRVQEVKELSDRASLRELTRAEGQARGWVLGTRGACAGGRRD